MAISVVGTPQEGSALDGGDVTLTFDGTPAEGDVVVLVGGHAPRSGSPLGPSTSGYTEIASTLASNIHGGAWLKVLGATPDSNVVGQGSGNADDGTAYVCIVLRGVDGTTPQDATATTATDISTNPDPASITTATDGAWVIPGVVNSRTANPFAPSGYSNQADASADDIEDAAAALATKEVATAGAEDPAAWTNWNAGEWFTITIAIRPDTGTAEDPANLQVTVDGSDVTLTWDASF